MANGDLTLTRESHEDLKKNSVGVFVVFDLIPPMWIARNDDRAADLVIARDIFRFLRPATVKQEFLPALRRRSCAMTREVRQLGTPIPPTGSSPT
jgi:hypothetical protein